MTRPATTTRDTERAHGAAHDALADAAPAPAPRRVRRAASYAAFEDDDDDAPRPAPLGALAVLRSGLGDKPGTARRTEGDARVRDRRRGRQATDPDPDPAGPRPGHARPTASEPSSSARPASAPVVIAIGVLCLSRIAYLRLVRAAEDALYSLRVRVFEHIHRLSVAEHNETQARHPRLARHERHRDARPLRGVGRDRWVVNGTLIVGTLVVMFDLLVAARR